MVFKGKVRERGDGSRLSQVAGATAGVGDVEPAAARDLSRRPNAPFLGAQAGGDTLGRTLELFEIDASVPEGKITEGLGALMHEAKRVQQYGFSADELNRATHRHAGRLRASLQGTQTSESPSYANEYVRHFLQQEPIPGIEVEYKIASTYIADDHLGEVTALAKSADHRRQPRRPRRGAGEEGHAAAHHRDAADGDRSRGARAGGALGGSDDRPRAGREGARAWQGRPRSARSPDDRRHRADAVERRRGVAEAHRLQERSNPVHGLRAGRHVARAGRTTRTRVSPPRWSVSAAWAGSSPVDLSKMLSGKIAQASPSIGDYTVNMNGIEHAEGPRDRAQAELPRVHGSRTSRRKCSSC